MNIRLLLTICFVFCAGTSPVLAQSYSRNLETLSALNRVNPLQNYDYDRAYKVLGRRVIDRKNKVIGEVHDIILKDNGNIYLLSVDFNKLRLREEVFLNFREMRIKTVSNGYALNFSDDQVEELYPSLLASIETAAGGEDVFSVRKVIGASIQSEDGRNIGRVDDVLFAASGNRAEALYIDIRQGALRGKKMAIPFGMGKFSHSGSGTVVMINDESADSILDFAKTQ